MVPGSLVRNRWEGSYLPLYEKIHGVMVSEYKANEIGIVIDFGYSPTDVPYVRIITSDGKCGWVRYEKVEVIVT